MIPVYRGKEIQSFLNTFNSRQQGVSGEVSSVVQDICQTVREKGDEALFAFKQHIDTAWIQDMGLWVACKDIQNAAQSVSKEFLDILKQSIGNIRKYHEKGKSVSWLTWEDDGVILGQKVTPLRRIGIYVPGGRAVYPSSLLMAAVPAQVAGVEEIVLVSPPDQNGKLHPSILAAASVLGLQEVYRVGGAHAIAGLAFGTTSMKPVDKIVGPGNMYVADAKRQVYGIVDIDMVAGPSEVVILADGSANQDHVAADLLAQAEHDPTASSILITPSEQLATKTQKAVQSQGKKLNRKEIFEFSLKTYGGILITTDMKESIELVNDLAAEHLGLHIENPWDILGEIRNGGAIFLGSYSPETVGDYWAGPNHILPTNRTARFSSPLGTEDFLKKSSLIQYTKEALQKNARSIIMFANTEGFDGHANAVRQRID